jgi:hypothetical protein
MLDEAAKRIVRQGAPYGAFPPEVRKNYEILNITRTWTFHHLRQAGKSRLIEPLLGQSRSGRELAWGPSMSTLQSVDLFCKVIDNYGDIGVCWRLARQLRQEHGLQVRLWVDDLASFRPLVSGIAH